MSTHPWSRLLPGLEPIRIRIGMHTGEPVLARQRDRATYHGPPTNRAARVSSAGHGGQILLSEATRILSRAQLAPEIRLQDLGEFTLRGVGKERLWQVLHPDLPRDFPPLEIPGAYPNNLPAQLRPLVGRERELEEIRRLLEARRLVTLTGPGGVGKTRLSLGVAEAVLPRFPGGVFFVQLAPVRDPDLALSTVAQALGLREAGERPLQESLREHFGKRRALLVLDNFEQIAPAAGQIGELLAACPGLKALVTSRAALHLQGEQEYPVPLLALPDLKLFPDLEALSQFSAVALFIERARAARPDFEVTNENAPAVAEICIRLDGLPLAIELAAARTKILSPHALLQRLEKRLRLLTGGPRDLPARQQTLRSAIAWSHDLLDEEERKLFRRLAVLVGGCTLESAEAVAGLGEWELDVLDGITSLVDKSLVLQTQQSDSEVRFTMLETIREYALEELEQSGDAAPAREAHARHFRAFVEEVEALPRGARKVAGWKRLHTEIDNIRATLQWVLDGGETEIGLRLGSALWRFWAHSGFLTEGQRWLEKLLAMPQASGFQEVWAGALYADGCLAEDRGDYVGAEERYQPALERYEELGEREGIAHCLTALGSVAMSRGEYRTARDYHSRSLAIWRELRDEAGIAVALSNLGTVSWSEGEYGAAQAYHEESLVLRRKLGDVLGEAVSLNSLGLLASRRGALEEARSWYEQGMEILRQTENRAGIAVSLNNLAEIATRQGNHTEARSRLAECLELLLEIGDRLSTAYALETLGTTLHRTGSAADAVRVFGAAGRLREQIGAPLPPNEGEMLGKEIDAALGALGQQRYEALLEEGRAMSLEEAAALASNETGSPK